MSILVCHTDSVEHPNNTLVLLQYSISSQLKEINEIGKKRTYHNEVIYTITSIHTSDGKDSCQIVGLVDSDLDLESLVVKPRV